MNYRLGIGVLCACLSGSQALAAEELRGDAFAPNDKSISMPAGWELKSVAYDKTIQDADLVVSFGQQTHPALQKVTEQYARDNNLKIVLQSGTCGVSAGKLLRKSIDAGTFCCPPSSKDRLPGLEFHTIAISALSVFVNEKNPLKNISTEQARLIFQGKMRSWEDVNKSTQLSGQIRPQARLHCKNRPGHWTLLLKSQEKFSPTLKEVGVIPDLVAKVGQEEDAVSIETPFMINTYKKGPVKMLTIDNHAPTDLDYVASGKYPFYRTYSITTWANGGKQRDRMIKLIAFLKQYIADHATELSMVPVDKLKQTGWKFKGDELVAEPNGAKPVALPPRN
ncbi:MAG: hypothetical protein OEY07_03000 [Gammaproteobacteria bacterium]|nr:hypothetical protein [Gammaproteobacteria bacterium]